MADYRIVDRNERISDGNNWILRAPHGKYHEPHSFYKLQMIKERKVQVVGFDHNKLICNLPNGQSIDIEHSSSSIPSPGAVISINYTEEANSVPTFLRTREDLKWKLICKEFKMPYMLSVYENRQHYVPHCRGCGKAFTNPAEARVQTTTLYSAIQYGLHPISINICTDPGCIQDAVSYYKEKDIVVSPFDGRIGVDPGTIPKSELPKMDGITWVDSLSGQPIQ